MHAQSSYDKTEVLAAAAAVVEHKDDDAAQKGIFKILILPSVIHCKRVIYCSFV